MKKGLLSFNMMMWIPRIIFMVIVVFSIVLLVATYFKLEMAVSEAENELFIQRLLYSPHGISFYDPYSNRIYPGIIDLDNLDLLNKSIFYGEQKHIGAKLSINDLNNSLLAERVYNDIVYRRIAQEGKGGVDVLRKSLYVIVRNESRQIPGTLAMEVVLIPKG
ncbi:hypothetical protein KY343_00715 [Candidatus Woesearchaeota archaeon]|nr:hypothetical protein [Candidatus Woesearchaeota archaeon]